MLLLPRGRGKDEFKERRKETRHTPGALKKKDPPARRGQPERTTEGGGGSSGRKDTATVRRYKTILFLPSPISFLLFLPGFCAAGILNRLDNVIRLLDVFSKNYLNVTSFFHGYVTLVTYSSSLLLLLPLELLSSHFPRAMKGNEGCLIIAHVSRPSRRE